MKQRISHDAPRYLRHYVRNNGGDGVYWMSTKALGARSARGEGVEDLVNRVSGSSLTATQSTQSARPINRGTHIEFAGDDAFTTSGWFDDGVPAGWTMFAVWQRASGTDGQSLAGWADAANDGKPSIWILSNDDTTIRTKTTDPADDTANAFTTSVSVDTPVVTAHRINWSAGESVVWADNGTSSDKVVATGAIDRPAGTMSVGEIGGQSDGDFLLSGQIYEIASFETAFSDARIDEIIDELKVRWRI